MSSQKSQQSKRAASRRGGQRPQTNSPQHPPVFDAAVTFNQKFRFKASAALVNTQIGVTNVINLLTMALTATTAGPLCSAVKLKRVSIWAPPAQDLVPVTCSVEFASGSSGNIGARPRVHSDTSVGATRVASVSVRPEPNSAPAMWQSRLTASATSPTVLFILNGPANAIIDLDLSYVLQNGETPPTALATTGAVPGTVYLDNLDTGNLIVPISWIPLP